MENNNVPTAFTEEDINDILQDNNINIAENQDANDADDSNISREDWQVAQRQLNEAIEDFNERNNVALARQSTPTTSNVNTIPANSPTLLIDQTTTRFSGAEWFNEIKKARIIIAGVGGIGSNLAFQLARMTPANITLYDADNVELVNLAGQLYKYSDVGRAKVNAVASMISKYTAMHQINAIQELFTDTTEAGDIMMCGFDNMKARKMFFNSWLSHIQNKSPEEKAKCLYLDGRLSMDELQIFCIKGDDEYNIQRYQKDFLFSDAEAEHTICSMKQTTYLACMIGSLMTNLFTNFIANSLDPIIPYDLPFYTEYDAKNMLFQTEK